MSNLFLIRKVRIATRMYALISLFVLFVIILGLLGLDSIVKVRINTTELYNHPFRVTNAVNRISFNIRQIEIALHNLALTKDDSERAMFMNKLLESDQAIESLFELIRPIYLGNVNDVDDALDAYLHWQEEWKLSLQAIQTNTKEGYLFHDTLVEQEQQITGIFQKLEIINNFATRKAAQFINDSNMMTSKYSHQLILIMILIVIFLGAAAALLIKSIVSPLKNLNNYTRQDNQDKLILPEAGVIYDEIDELTVAFGELTNKLIDANHHLEEKIVERTSKLAAEIEEHRTAQGQLQRSEELFRSMLDADLFGAVFWEQDGTITQANDAYLRIIGYSREEFETEGLNWKKITPDTLKDAEDERSRALMEGQLKPYRKKYIHRDGHLVSVLVGAARVMDEPFMGIAFVIDISEQVANEQELQKYQDNLEKVIQERTQKLETNIAMVDESRRALTYLLEDVNDSRNELERVNTQLDSVNKELEAFSYSVSHDLKAPLRAIDGFSLALEEDYYEIISEEGKEFIRLIRNNARKMGQLINDLLEFSRMGRKAIEYSDIDLKEMATEVFTELTADLPKRNIHLFSEGGCHIWGDQKMLKQVVINLLSNAIKFTKDEEEAIIEIGCRTLEREMEVYFRDNGVGFDMKYIDKLFGVFQRLHSDEDFEGTGVGLALVKRILAKHQGMVWAKSELNKGATFYFTLPHKDTLGENNK
ncbi:MAG: PAS domain S-box protein [Candidatus Cloacimonetes bacterium]|nr:PAS domain S-box protein [Candidatus Cloacimonadota bacterium]